MIGVRLDKETEERLERLAKETHRSKSHYVKEAIADYLAEKEDILLAMARLEKGEKPVSAEALWESLGWEQDHESEVKKPTRRSKAAGKTTAK
ncbi:MAG: ribbon-helix-helix domain-containing protein [Acidobacteriota bacterium]